MPSSTSRTLQVIAIAAAIIAAIWLLSDVVAAIFFAVLIAVILRALTNWVSRHTRLPAPLALILVILVLGTAIGGLGYRIAPKLIDQGQALFSNISGQVEALQSSHGPAWLQSMLHRISSPATLDSHIETSTRKVIALTAHGLVTMGVLLVSAFYFALDPGTYLSGFVQLFPPSYRARLVGILQMTGKTLLLWSLGQFIEMGVVGTLVIPGLYLLHVPLALALGVLAALLTFVPYLGPIAAAIPALMMGFSVRWQTGLWVLGIFLCCHVVDAYVVGPFVQKRTVRLPPALTVLSMTVLGSLFGPLGIVIGAPVTAVLLVVVREAYVVDVLQAGRAEHA